MSKMTPEFFEGVMWAVNQLTDSAEKLLDQREALLNTDSYAYNNLGRQAKGQVEASEFIILKTKETNEWQPPKKLPTP